MTTLGRETKLPEALVLCTCTLHEIVYYPVSRHFGADIFAMDGTKESIRRRLILVFNKASRGFQVSLDHFFYERVKVDFALPPKDTLSFCWVPKQ